MILHKNLFNNNRIKYYQEVFSKKMVNLKDREDNLAFSHRHFQRGK